MKPGDDASCLNLFQATTPTLLGVPGAMIERGGFKIVGGGDEVWKKLLQRDGVTAPVSRSLGNDRDTYPVLGDMNTLMFNLKKGMGSSRESADGPATNAGAISLACSTGPCSRACC